MSEIIAEFVGGPWDGQTHLVGLHEHIAVPVPNDFTWPQTKDNTFRIHYYRLYRSDDGVFRYVTEDASAR